MAGPLRSKQQMQGPLYDAHEMGNTRDGLLRTINALPEYRRLFAIAYPDSKSGLRLEHIYGALTAFESSLVSLNSRYDLYAQGFHEALSPNEVEGLNVFRSFVARCSECHTPPLFTNQQIAVIGMPEPKGRAFDVGAEKISNEPTLRGGFKVPSLRNVALTAPYNHSGRFQTLHDAVEFYNMGRGHAVPKDEKLTLHWHIWEPKLSAAEIDRLVDFLGALTDESFRPARPRFLPSGLKTDAPGRHQQFQDPFHEGHPMKKMLIGALIGAVVAGIGVYFLNPANCPPPRDRSRPRKAPWPGPARPRRTPGRSLRNVASAGA